VTATLVGGYRALPESLTAITLMANPMNVLRSRTPSRLYVYDAVLQRLAQDLQDVPAAARPLWSAFTLSVVTPDSALLTTENVTNRVCREVGCDREVAQFIYLLLCNEKIREVINTITAKAVLIPGRLTPERHAVLDAIREALRHRNDLPILSFSHHCGLGPKLAEHYKLSHQSSARAFGDGHTA
jgi:hypothetical protein